METKFNEATVNRPEGDRIIDAPFVLIDLEKFSKQIKSEPGWEKNDKNSITVFKTDGFTIILTWLHKDAIVNNTLSNGLFTIQVLEGEITVSIEASIIPLGKNQLITIHPSVMYSMDAKKDSLILISNKKEEEIK